MGFRIKVAPGVRVSVGHHSVRTHIGPRIARVHVGSGRTGVSTGAGPLTLYRAVGSSTRRRSSSSGSGRTTSRSSPGADGGRTTSRSSSSDSADYSRPRTGSYSATKAYENLPYWPIAQAAKWAQVFEGIDRLLRQSFETAKRPVAPSPIVDKAEIRQRHRADALAGVGVRHRADRLQAKERADRDADAEIAKRLCEGEVVRVQLQKELDAVCEPLLDHDPGLLLQQLNKAFKDNEARAAAIGVNGAGVDVIVVVPGLEFIPRGQPKKGIFGGFTWHALTNTERSSYHEKMVCGRLLNAVRQTFAVAPGVNGVTATVIANSFSYGTSRLECLLTADFTRDSFANIDWKTAFAPAVLLRTSSDLRISPADKTQELDFVDLSKEPDLEHLLEQLDISGLARPSDPVTEAASENTPGLSKRATPALEGTPKMIDVSEQATPLEPLTPAASDKTLDTLGHTVPSNQATPAASAKTLGALLDEAEQRGSLGSPLLIHLAPGDAGVANGRAFAEMVAAIIDKPLRVIAAADTRSEVAACLLQRLVPGQVVYLERVEDSPADLLPFMLAALCDRLVLLPSNETRLVEFDGQYLLRAQLEIVVEAARRRDQPVDHVLLVGPPSFDKAALAGFVAREMGAGLRTISGRELVQSSDVAAMLTDLDPGDVLFIDQIHRVGPKVEALLYRAMEDFQLDIVLGRGGAARSIRLDLPKFTIVGATTNLGRLSAPLRDRFGLQLTAETHSPETLSRLVRRIWDQAGLSYEDDAAHLVAERSMGVPWRAYILASLVVRSQTSSDDLGSTLTARLLCEILEEYAFDDKGFTEADWWLQDLRFGSGKYIYGPHGSLPRVSTIVSTSSPWKADSDTRDAFGSLAEALPYRLVMPRLHSRDAIMLRWEARNIPLIA